MDNEVKNLPYNEKIKYLDNILPNLSNFEKIKKIEEIFNLEDLVELEEYEEFNNINERLKYIIQKSYKHLCSIILNNAIKPIDEIKRIFNDHEMIIIDKYIVYLIYIIRKKKNFLQENNIYNDIISMFKKLCISKLNFITLIKHRLLKANLANIISNKLLYTDNKKIITFIILIISSHNRMAVIEKYKGEELEKINKIIKNEYNIKNEYYKNEELYNNYNGKSVDKLRKIYMKYSNSRTNLEILEQINKVLNTVNIYTCDIEECNLEDYHMKIMFCYLDMFSMIDIHVDKISDNRIL